MALVELNWMMFMKMWTKGITNTEWKINQALTVRDTRHYVDM